MIGVIGGTQYAWRMAPCLICHRDFATCAGPLAAFCSALCALKGERIAIDKRGKGFALLYL
jgi:hypothetical protein